MKMTFQKLVLGAVAAIIAGPMIAGTSAEAGDYSGGLKGLRGTHVPVPAPVPIPDHRAKWYLRADVGFNLSNPLSSTESGMTYGNDAGIIGPATFGFSSLSNFGQDEGHDIGYSIGFGAGYYFTSNWRMDVTGEFRSDQENMTTGQFQYNDGVTRVDGSVRDKTTLKSAIFLASAYYDINRLGRWSPYIGGGLGFAVNEIERTHTTDLTTCPVVCVTPAAAAGYNVSSSREYAYTLAANMSAGVAYRVSDVTSLDFNYRYLYVGGTDISATINGNNSTVDIDDQHEHYLRAGLRFDIN